MNANAKLVIQIASKAPGSQARSAKATTGPMSDPPASSALWTAKALASDAFPVTREITASRGAVRAPLPARSIATAAMIQPHDAPATISSSLHTADTP